MGSSAFELGGCRPTAKRRESRLSLSATSNDFQLWFWSRVERILHRHVVYWTGNKGGLIEPSKDKSDMQIAKPNRAAHTHRLHLPAAPENVFPLFCPVRETEWADGWSPTLVVSSCGVVERDCVFITEDKRTSAIWYVMRHDPDNFFLEMLKIVPGVTACRLNIQLGSHGTGCTADISYTHTSLGPAGDELVAGFTAEHYQKFMRAWEDALNYFLATGRLLREHSSK
jgi:hypothetical protein